MPRELSPAEALALMGQTIGASSSIEVSQELVDAFARLTEDEQWIHVDPVRAAGGPFGGTVAHGFLLLALLPKIAREVVCYPNARMVINYGLDRVRFLSPVRVGAHVSGAVKIIDARRSETGTRVTMEITVTADSESRPVCVVELIYLVVD